MSYPFILAYNGDEFARVNHDGSWSVDWKKAINVRYETPTKRNKAIIACAIVLLAAKDNFFLTPWEQSDTWKDKWDHRSRPIDLHDVDPDEGAIEFSIAKGNDSCARVNFDGTWSVIWETVEQVAREPNESWKTVALSSFCKLLMAAQFNFATVPWKDTDDEEDDDE